MAANKRTAVVELQDVVLTKKPKKPSLQTIFDFHKPACLQNTLQSPNWRKGDPNDETRPDYDFTWLIWILRQVFPKDIVTHFISLNGGVSFTLYRSLPIAGQNFEPKLELTFWRDGYGASMGYQMTRNIYFNIPLQKIKREKGRTYIWYKDGKSYYVEE
jgi:hypothetical protein